MNAHATATTVGPSTHATGTVAAASKPQSTYAVIALANIATSDTPMQKMRRQHFDKAALGELAASIKALGVLQPVLVRPDPKFTSGGYYTLVAGERRYLAAKQAGLAAIPATIRQLTDLEVIEMQVVENNQREGLHELIEAEGFDQLRREHKLSADDIAAKVGKSRRYVFNRLKLCDLCPEAKTAFYDGKIGGTVAFQIARIGHHDTQRECLRELLHGKGKDEQPSKRYAEEHIRRNYLLALDGKSFPIGDATLCPKAGACGPCPKRTGNQAELFDDIKGNGNICTDPKCFADKANAFIERRRAEAVKAGRTVITGKAAKEMMPSRYSSSINGAVKPDDTCWDDPKHRSYKAILGKDAPATALIENPHDKKELIEIWPKSEISKVLKEKLPEKKKVTRSSSGVAVKDDNSAELRKRFEADLLKLVRTKHSGKIGLLELQHLTDLELNNLSDESPVYADWKLPTSYNGYEKALSEKPEKDLHKILIESLVSQDVFGFNLNGFAAKLCKQLKIDPKKVKASAIAALKKEKAAAAAAAKATTKNPATTTKPAAKKKAVAKK